MGIKPNVVVGAVGLVVLLITGSILATNWRTLTDQRTYVASVETQDRQVGDEFGTVNPGGSERETFEVDDANVTAFVLRVTWDDLGVTRPQHRVAVSVQGPDGQALGSSSRTGGTAGITVERTITDAPEGSRFTSTPAAASGEVDERYPTDDDLVGPWVVTITTDAPTGGAGITYRATLEVSFYRVDVVEESSILGVK